MGNWVSWYETDTCALGGGDSIALTTTGAYENRRLISVGIRWTAGVAPGTGENFTIHLDSALGASYDQLLYTIDPNAEGAYDILWRPDNGPLPLGKNDQIRVTYANTDDLAITCVVTTERE